MFLQELNPLVQEFAQQPIAFVGGFVAGALRLNLSEDPLKSWLEKQGVTSVSANSSDDDNHNKPQSISIS